MPPSICSSSESDPGENWVRGGGLNKICGASSVDRDVSLKTALFCVIWNSNCWLVFENWKLGEDRIGATLKNLWI